MSKERTNNCETNPVEEILNWIKDAIFFSIFSNHERFGILDDLTLNIPPPYIKADYALSVFGLSEMLGQTPSLIARCIVDHCSKEYIALVTKIYAVGSYINFIVDKDLFYRRTLNYIESRGSSFGVSQKKKLNSIQINNLDINFRAVLIERVMSRGYILSGNDVLRNGLNNIEDIPLITCQEIVKDVLKHKIARYITGTNVIITLPFGGISSVVLQKQDRSFTRNTLYLAYQKKKVEKIQPSEIIHISSVGEVEIVKSLIYLAKKLKYIPTQVDTSIISVNQTNAKRYMSGDIQSLVYALLRVSPNEKALLKHDKLLIYSHLSDTVCYLKKNHKEINLDKVFNLVKFLIIFPDVIDNSINSKKLENICVYLERVADLCNKDSCFMDRRLSHVAALVIANGLDLLTF